MLIQRATGPYRAVLVGDELPAARWCRSPDVQDAAQTNIPVMFAVSLLLNLGMWLERWMIVTPTFSHGYYPWTWNHDLLAVLGSVGHRLRQLRLVRHAVHAVLQDRSHASRCTRSRRWCITAAWHETERTWLEGSMNEQTHILAPVQRLRRGRSGCQELRDTKLTGFNGTMSTIKSPIEHRKSKTVLGVGRSNVQWFTLVGATAGRQPGVS